MKYILNENTTKERTTHPIDLFFEGLSATVKNLTPEYQYLAITKAFQLISELEFSKKCVGTGKSVVVV